MRYISFIGAAGGGGGPPTDPPELYPGDGTIERYGHTCDASRDGSTVGIGDNINEKVYIFTDPDADFTWPLLQTLTSPGGTVSEFGSGVGLNSDGTVLAVTEFDTSTNSGLVHIYDLSGGSYSLTQTIALPTYPGWMIQSFCTGPSFSDDASRLFLGDPDATDGDGTNGIVFVYKRTAGTYSLEDTILPVDFGGATGHSIDANAAGDTLVITQRSFGLVGVRKRSGTTWSWETNVDGSFWSLPGGTLIASRIMCTESGNLAVVVSWQEGQYHASMSRSGSTWSAVDTFQTSTDVNDQALTYPDRTADLSSDGGVMVFGGSDADIGAETSCGRVVVFSGSAGSYSETGQIEQPDGAETNALFGWAVAVPGDGSFVVVTAPEAFVSSIGDSRGRAWIIYL